jgi:hypothetical protein
VLRHNHANINGVPQTLVIRRYAAMTKRWHSVGGTKSYAGSLLDQACTDYLTG